MIRPFARGCIVARGPMLSVVLTDRGADGLELLPIIRARRPWLHDVALLELAELVAMGGVVPAGSVIRPKANPPVPAAGWRVVGELPSAAWCRVAVELVRIEVERTCRERWSGDREHKRRARGMRPVNLVAA